MSNEAHVEILTLSILECLEDIREPIRKHARRRRGTGKNYEVDSTLPHDHQLSVRTGIMPVPRGLTSIPKANKTQNYDYRTSLFSQIKDHRLWSFWNSYCCQYEGWSLNILTSFKVTSGNIMSNRPVLHLQTGSKNVKIHQFISINGFKTLIS